MYVCFCNKVTDKEIRQAVEAGHDSLDALRSELKVGTCCGRCNDCARQLIQTTVAEQWSAAPEFSFA